MFSKFLIIAAAAVAVQASPVERRDATIALPVTKHSHVTSVSNIVARGKAVINKINSGSSLGKVDASSGPVTNEDVSYVAAIDIGGKTWSLIVDTGCMFLICDSAHRNIY